MSCRNFALPFTLLAGAMLAGCSSNSSVAPAGTPTGPGTLALAASTTAAAQIQGTLVIPVSRANGSTGAVSVAYVTTDGTAVSGADYTGVNGTLNWADGDSTIHNIYIPLNTTPNFYGSRSFTLTLSAPTGSATLGTVTSTVVTIAGGLASPNAGTLAFSASTATSSENNGFVTLLVNRTAGANGTASVNYATANGTATAGAQYTASSGTVTWADGDATPKTITIPLISTAMFSGTETFTVTLSSPSGSLSTPTLGSTVTATVSLTTATAPGVLGFSAATTAVNQSAGTVSIAVTRTVGNTGAVGVNYATANGTAVAGTDYTAETGTLSWATGDGTTKYVTVPISTALAFNGTKTFTVSLSGPTGAATLGTTVTNTTTITGTALVPSSCTHYNFAPWKLGLPIDQYGGTGGTNGIQYAATSASPAQIQAGFVDAYFYADANCNIIFTAPVDGAVTTPGVGSDHTRSELRELYTGTGADSNSDWNSTIGGTLTATGHVNTVSSFSDEATIAQIHGQTYVFMLLIFRPSYNDIAVDIYTTNTSTSGHTRTEIATGITYGTTFNYTLKYSGNTITATVNGNTMSFPIDSSWAGTPVYFKVGAYHAASPNYGAVPDDQTQVSFSAFGVTHP